MEIKFTDGAILTVDQASQNSKSTKTKSKEFTDAANKGLDKVIARMEAENAELDQKTNKTKNKTKNKTNKNGVINAFDLVPSDVVQSEESQNTSNIKINIAAPQHKTIQPKIIPSKKIQPKVVPSKPKNISITFKGAAEADIAAEERIEELLKNQSLLNNTNTNPTTKIKVRKYFKPNIKIDLSKGNGLPSTNVPITNIHPELQKEKEYLLKIRQDENYIIPDNLKNDPYEKFLRGTTFTPSTFIKLIMQHNINRLEENGIHNVKPEDLAAINYDIRRIFEIQAERDRIITLMLNKGRPEEEARQKRLKDIREGIHYIDESYDIHFDDDDRGYRRIIIDNKDGLGREIKEPLAAFIDEHQYIEALAFSPHLNIIIPETISNDEGLALAVNDFFIRMSQTDKKAKQILDKTNSFEIKPSEKNNHWHTTILAAVAEEYRNPRYKQDYLSYYKKSPEDKKQLERENPVAKQIKGIKNVVPDEVFAAIRDQIVLKKMQLEKDNIMQSFIVQGKVYTPIPKTASVKDDEGKEYTPYQFLSQFDRYKTEKLHINFSDDIRKVGAAGYRRIYRMLQNQIKPIRPDEYTAEFEPYFSFLAITDMDRDDYVKDVQTTLAITQDIRLTAATLLYLGFLVDPWVKNDENIVTYDYPKDKNIVPKAARDISHFYLSNSYEKRRELNQKSPLWEEKIMSKIQGEFIVDVHRFPEFQERVNNALIGTYAQIELLKEMGVPFPFEKWLWSFRKRFFYMNGTFIAMPPETTYQTMAAATEMLKTFREQGFQEEDKVLFSNHLFPTEDAGEIKIQYSVSLTSEKAKTRNQEISIMNTVMTIYPKIPHFPFKRKDATLYSRNYSAAVRNGILIRVTDGVYDKGPQWQYYVKRLWEAYERNKTGEGEKKIWFLDPNDDKFNDKEEITKEIV